MKFTREIAAKASSMSNYVVVVSHFAFSFVVLSTLFDVFLRYFASRPILGVIELNQCMMPVMVFMAIGLTQRNKGHIRVTLLVNRFKE
jgi:TRAP-type C4-dicarboxylate transport system permease small subunit